MAQRIRQSKKIGGFTLVEVVVALAFLAIALLGFHQGQSGSARMAKKAESKAQAMGLAQMQMTDTENKVKKQGFTSLPEKDKGEFEDESFKKFRWSRELSQVNLGCFMPTPKTTEESGQGGIFKFLQEIAEKAIRKIEIIVEWEEGGKTQKVHLSQLYVRFEDIPKLPSR